MLQTANRKLASTTEWVASSIGRASTKLNPLARVLLGSWQPPAWVRFLFTGIGHGLRWLQARLAWLLMLALLVAGGWFAKPGVLAWWHGLTPDRPKVTVATLKLTPPPRTVVETGASPSPLVVDFSASVAPIATVGQEASGVTLAPALAGRWTWAKANRLEFQPAQEIRDRAAEQCYSIPDYPGRR